MAMADMTDGPGQWLADARAGSPDALGRALEACRAYLLLVAERELNPALRAKAGASDIVQQTFLEAQRDFGRFHGGSEAELLAWLRHLLRNNLADFARTYRPTGKRAVDREVALHPTDSTAATPDPPADIPTPSRVIADREEETAVQQAIATLPDDYQTVLTLRYREGLPFEVIAERMGRTGNAVRKLWARAVERLQEALGSES